MDPSKCEFLAERTIISVIPKFNDPRIVRLISGDIGPFRAGIPVNIPIWVALNLRRKQKCVIVPPDWMDVQVLEEKLEEEKNSRFFTKMPSDCYMEISNLLLSAACDDIRNSNRIRTAIKDLWDYRISKAQSSAKTFVKTGGRHAGINNLTQLEIQTLRPSLTDALDTIYHFSTRQPLNMQSSGQNGFSQSFTGSIPQ